MDDLEIDLHGLRVPEAIARLSEACNRRLRAGDGRPLHVIHGYGSSGRGGGLRDAVRDYLDRNSTKVEYIPGERYFNNPGMTIVYPKHTLPATGNRGFPLRFR